jgi:hypothetical protein
MDNSLLLDGPRNESHRYRLVTGDVWGTGQSFDAEAGLLAYRLWRINIKGSSLSHRRLYSVIFIMVESGAIYSAALLALLILYKTDSWFQYVILDAVSAFPLLPAFI